MDDITRDRPIDTTTGGTSKPRGKGPDDVLLHDRLRLSEDGAGEEPADRVTGDEVAHGPDEAESARLDESAGDAEERDPDESDVQPEDGLPPVPELTDPEVAARLSFVLLLSQREGLSTLRLCQALNTTAKLVQQGLDLLQQKIDGLGLPLEIGRTDNTVRLLSTPDAHDYLVRLRGVKKQEKLSPAALETLAVIAYRQPVMRSEIEAIRGVKAGPMLRMLLQHKLVRVTGRADVPGRPLQYGTTDHFLERFGLASLKDLPSIKEWKQLG